MWNPMPVFAPVIITVLPTWLGMCSAFHLIPIFFITSPAIAFDQQETHARLQAIMHP
jgi:hypothetical protein